MAKWDGLTREQVLERLAETEKLRTAIASADDYASELASASERAVMVGQRPASWKQITFIANLLFEKNLKPTAFNLGYENTQAILNIKTASSIISDLLNGQN